MTVRVSDLHTQPTPRRGTLHGQDAALEASVRARGVLFPLIVSARPAGGYAVLDGNRRARAARRAGVEDVAVLLVDERDGAYPGEEHYNEAGMHLSLATALRDIDLVDHVLERVVARSGETPEGVIAAWKKLKKDPEADLEARAALVGVLKDLGIGFLDGFLEMATKLLRLSEDLLSPLREGALDSAQALAIAPCKDEVLRAQLQSKAERGELSAQQIKRAIKDAKEVEAAGEGARASGEEGDPGDAEAGGDQGAQSGPSGIEDIENLVEERIRRLPGARQAEAKRYLRQLRAVFTG